LNFLSLTILHKTELGVMRLGIGDEAALRRAYAEIADAARGHELRGVLVQPMIPGIEVIVGARVDPVVEPLVVVGSGGVLWNWYRTVWRRLRRYRFRKPG